MKPFGYITLKEAEEISGKGIEALKKQCQSGRIRGAIKDGGNWYVPRDEIVIRRGHDDDSALGLMVMMAEIVTEGVYVTVYGKGLVLSGRLISTKKYIDSLRDSINVTADYERDAGEPDPTSAIKERLDAYFDVIISAAQEGKNQFVHLDEVHIVYGNNIVKQTGTNVRLQLSSIDGYHIGSIS